MQQTLTTLGLVTHPDKTFIGRVERGFDFLGYHITPHGLSVAEETLRRFVARVTRLYEHGRGRPLGSAPLGSYVRRWIGWAAAPSRGSPGGALVSAGVY